MDDEKQKKQIERIHRRRQVAKFMRQGVTPPEMRDRLGLPATKESIWMIHKDIKTILKEWVKATSHDTEVWRSKQIVQYQKVAGELLESWNNSKKDRKKVRTRKRAGESSATRETETEKTDGNPAYLSLWVAVMTRLDQLLGLTAPNGVVLEKKLTLVQASGNFFANIQARANELKEGGGLPAPKQQEVVDVPKEPEPVPEPPKEVKQLPPPDKTDWHGGASFPGAAP